MIFEPYASSSKKTDISQPFHHHGARVPEEFLVYCRPGEVAVISQNLFFFFLLPIRSLSEMEVSLSKGRRRTLFYTAHICAFTTGHGAYNKIPFSLLLALKKNVHAKRKKAVGGVALSAARNAKERKGKAEEGGASPFLGPVTGFSR